MKTKKPIDMYEKTFLIFKYKCPKLLKVIIIKTYMNPKLLFLYKKNYVKTS